MAISFSYNEATNRVVVTGGTEGTPATFADFVTADRAGTDTKLLDAGSPANDLALTYAVRPVENLAIKVKCVVANKTAETDYIFITGKDWKGDAQTESIDVSAGNGSYETTKYWSEITTLDCSDNPAGGGTVWADGDLTVTQDIWGVIWDYGNGQYRIDSAFLVGDGFTATFFKTIKELLYFSITTAAGITDYANAIFQSGNLGALDTGYDGSTFIFSRNGLCYYNYQGTSRLYGSKFIQATGDGTGTIRIYSSDSEIFDSQFYGFQYTSIKNSPSLKNILVADTERGINMQGSPALFENVSVGKYSSVGLYLLSIPSSVTLKGLSVTDDDSVGTDLRLYNFSFDSYIIDSILNFNITIGGTVDANLYEQYSCNIHIVNKDGVNINEATVACEDQFGTPVFSVNTNAEGNIVEQTISYRRHYNSGGITSQTYSPHKFTISKAGYETLVLDNITVDEPINWHLELQPLRARVYGRSHRIDVKQFI